MFIILNILSGCAPTSTPIECSELIQRDSGADGSIDENADGVPETATRISRVFDSNGNAIETYVDEGDDGLTDDFFWSEFEYSSNTENQYRDYGNDGSIETFVTQTYNENWLITKREEDVQNDGTLNYIHYNTWDEHDIRTEALSDYDADGTIDHRVTTVVCDGLAIEKQIDDDANSVIDEITYYQYNDNRLSETTWDRGNDGVIDIVWTHTYTCP